MDALARIAKVEEAVNALPDLVVNAIEATAQYGPADARTHAAWEKVEAHGATIHRQTRLLAGKKRGG